jgi:hypothetical protein
VLHITALVEEEGVASLDQYFANLGGGTKCRESRMVMIGLFLCCRKPLHSVLRLIAYRALIM